MTTPDLDSWLSAATRGLASDGVERIRTEIGDHYRYTLASGSTPEQAIAALGDPKQANRDYAQVFLTESEADTAARTADPKFLDRLNRSTFFFFTPFVLLASLPKSGRWMLWGILAPTVALDIVQYLFPASTGLHKRLYLVARILLFPWMAWQWYTHDALSAYIGGLVLLACLLLYGGALNRRIKRKLAGRPAPKLMPPPHGLSRWEELSLRRMRNHAGRLDGFVIIAMLAASAWFQPVVGVPALLLVIVRFLVPEFIPIDTPERSHRFRLVRSTLFALAALVPIIYGVSVHWEPRNDFLPFLKFFLVSGGVYGMLISGVVFEWQRVSIRRKLPAAEWPKELYL